MQFLVSVFIVSPCTIFVVKYLILIILVCSELREFDEQLLSLANLAGTNGTSRENSPVEVAGSGGYCFGCSSRRGCPCDECAMTHLLTCGGLITPPDSPSPLYR